MPTYYTTKQAADELGVTTGRILAMKRDGYFPNAEKWGRDWAIPAGDLNRARNRQPGNPNFTKKAGRKR